MGQGPPQGNTRLAFGGVVMLQPSQPTESAEVDTVARAPVQSRVCLLPLSLDRRGATLPRPLASGAHPQTEPSATNGTCHNKK